MSIFSHFVLGELAPSPGQGVGAYLPAMPEGVASAYIAALTQPGDLVLDPFCQTGRVLRESVALKRRALGSNFNPVAARWIESQLWPREAALVIAAFVRLGDLLRGDVPLRQHLLNLYVTRCPTCNKSAVAEWFIWDRDEGRPIKKHVRCAACKTDSTGPADEADVLAARKFEPHGMAYHFALERAIPDEAEADAGVRERAAAVVAAYTPRSLVALTDLLRKYDAVSAADQSALRPLLLTAFEAGLALHPADEERPRPRSLKIPPQFIERNVWLAMEDGLPSPADSTQAALPRAPDLDSLEASREPAAQLVAQSARDLARLVSAASVRLALAVPPEPDPTLWALSAVWAGWLWGRSARATETLRPLLARRRADVDWWWRGLAHALRALLPTLTQEGHVVLVSSDVDDDTLTGLLLAGASAGLTLGHALVEPRTGSRLMWNTVPAQPVRELDTDALATEIGDKARQVAVEIIRQRGEPTTWPFIHAAIQSELAHAGLLRIAAQMPESGPPPVELIEKAILHGLQAPRSPVYPVEDVRGLWWLTDPGKSAQPLSDRIEANVCELLARSGSECIESDLVGEVYRRFSGWLMPERDYIRLVLESYAIQTRPGVWAWREQDRPEARQQEVTRLRAELATLGKRLSCEVHENEGLVIWSRERRPIFAFAVSATAELGQHLLARRPPRGQPVLVLPGGRGALAHHKLRHDVRLRDAVAGAGWAFLKFRQLRGLITQSVLDMAAFRDALGQDPLIEKEGQQMTLL
jgi:hypothetical protein